ncbi:hypothetical protein [Shewanella pneumatophori]|uniref:Uncharacterized protein n=1 Tax=Shewanella pneumatophori TaxID=314092 RepID=A0A9X1ZGH1_9GAMM|nr:hypothetical protein [Shewanella pneumatophori]MCL1138985.1 hypothetical protein [Shewanella pneumatophori]
MLVSYFGQSWRSQTLFSKTAINSFVGISLLAGIAFNASATSCEGLSVNNISSNNISANNISSAKISSANERLNPEHLRATYSITTSQGGQQSLTLLRSADQVIYQRNDVSFELWNKQGEYVRYFPKQQRSISYRKGDLLSLNMQFDYQQLAQIVAPSTIQQLTAVNSVQPAKPNQLQAAGNIDLTCQQVTHYQGAQHNQQLKLAWLSELALPANMIMLQGEQQLNFQLVELAPLSSAEFAEHIANYRDMDFADVGDNESDPFIAQMIHQGFIQHGSSGFYDSHGNALSSGAGHQH